ncbi:hypothetical protein BGX33_000842 [Mortierella sp. NVP41]|nr:hypothetical protein BGX33_000842 [Mortierella sp. NVP41]
MERGRFIHELKVTLAWEVVTSADLKALRDAVHRSNIVYLHLKTSAPFSMGSLLSLTKASTPLWKMVTDAKLQTLILSDYQGFFSEAPHSIRSSTDLRTLRLSEPIRWKKDGPKLVELIRKSPRLSELSFGCPENDIREGYIAIRDVVETGGIPLRRLEIQADASDRTVVGFEQGRPLWMDFTTSDPLRSVLLQETKCLRSLHLRPVVLTQPGTEQSILARVMSQNPGLVRIAIRCHPSRFFDLFQYIKVASMDTSMAATASLKVVALYHGKNQLMTTDVHNDDATVLELMPSESATGPALEPLLRTYGHRLTKLRIDTARYHQFIRYHQSFWNESNLGVVLWQGDVSRLRHIEVTCSAMNDAMLSVLDSILKHPTFPASIPYFGIGIDILYQESSEICRKWVNFVNENSRATLTILKSSRSQALGILPAHSSKYSVP